VRELLIKPTMTEKIPNEIKMAKKVSVDLKETRWRFA
jgi:hypothetical protein